MTSGRLPIFDNPEDMQTAIDEYFDGNAWIEIDDKKVFAPTVSELAYELGMTTETLRAYGEKDAFSATVKRAKQRIEISLEKALRGNSVTGTIFNLKNNFGWVDQYKNDNTEEVKVIEVRKDFDEYD